MGLFGKKKRYEDEEYENNENNNENNIIAQPKEEYVIHSKLEKTYDTSTIADIVRADIERIKANIDSFKESRQITNERLARISEEIGELRSMLVDREKQIQELEVKAQKAFDMVAEVQPDKLMIEVKKEDNKIEALKAKIEEQDQIINQIINDFKSIKAQIGVFRGVEQIIELSEDVKRQLEVTRKLESDIKRHADKVEEIFITMKKKFPEIEEIKAVSQEMKEEHEKMLKDFEEVKYKIMNFSEKQEIDEIRELVNRNAQVWQRKLDEITNFRNQLGAIVDENKRAMEEIRNSIKIIDQKMFNVVQRDELVQRQKELKEEILSRISDEVTKHMIEKDIQKGKEQFSKIDEIKRIVAIANVQINERKIEDAKKSYLKANALYNQLDKEKQLEVYDILEDLYNRLKK